MESLNKTIKKLSNKDYLELLEEVTGNRKDKPFMVLDSARNKNLSDNEVIELLGVNTSTYYTLKSRLWDKIAVALSKEVDKLKVKTARAPIHLYNTNKNVSIKDLENLEKELIEYDLSSELIVVYKTLARLHLHTEDYEHYQKLYDKHVAFSLAVTKAEDLLYDFTKKMSKYLLTKSAEDLEDVKRVRREVANIFELYSSHRLYVLNSILKIYYWCQVPGDMNELKGREVEVDQMLQEIRKIFDKYFLDNFYQSIKPLVDMMYFVYYQKTENHIRADHHFKLVNALVPELCEKHMLSFYLIQFLNAKVSKYMHEGIIEKLIDQNKELRDNFEISKDESYNYAALQRFFAICKFYEGDFNNAAKIINDLRNEVSLRNYVYFEIELKLFQALQYCLIGNEELCSQLMVSITRQMPDEDPHFEPVKLFMKVMKNAMKTSEFRQKIKKVTDSWNTFQESDKGNYSWLWFVKMDEALIRRMSNPMK